MKRFIKLAVLLFLVFGVGGFGLWRYMQAGDQGQAAEAAADAMVNAANAAAEWARDSSTHQISVVNLMGTSRAGGIDGPFVVEARLAVKGGARMSELCAALPRVRDAINAVLVDRVGDMLRRGTPLAPDSFAAYDAALRDRLNREIAAGAVSQVRLVVHSARDVREGGCKDLKPTHTEAATR